MTLHTTAPASTVTRPEGTFVALVATYDVDRQMDRIVPGAFAKSLDTWRRSGKRIPVVWSHQSGDPSMVIGSASADASRETANGLVISGKLNIDNSATADHVYDLLADGSVGDWSFGYTIQDQRKAAGGITELVELDLLECGPTVAGANRAARTISIKGLPPEGREPPEVPSHTQLEARLAREGHIVRVVDPAMVESERDIMLEVLNRGRNGHEEGKVALARTKAGPVQVARFEA